MDLTNGFVIPGMSDIIFSVDGIQYQLSKLDTNKAKGLDNISLFILKHCTTEISPVLQVVFTQLLNVGTLPSDWLQVNICPILKKGNHTSASNYQPISLTSACSKIMKHILYHST